MNEAYDWRTTQLIVGVQRLLCADSAFRFYWPFTEFGGPKGYITLGKKWRKYADSRWHLKLH